MNTPNIYLYKAVDTCPYCGSKISPNYLTHYSECHEYSDIATYHVLCQCPNIKCNEIFYAKYSGELMPFQGPYGTDYELDVDTTEIYPVMATRTFEKEIIDLSPEFIETYRQASISENMQLNKICGSGYRLAFEFLIKDFAIKLNPEKETEIKNDTKLSNVIANRLPNISQLNDLKDIAKRAWWLGCDSTHYVRQYTDYDIFDLKCCIDLTVVSIVHYLKHQHYIQNIQKSKPSTVQ